MQKSNNLQLEATFLGTGTSQGVPVIACDCDVCHSNDEKDKRLRSSLLVKIGDFNIVIDSGPDFRAQMLRENINSLRAILL
ncbi:MAG TPA: MBL fold metallo-hydrolase, partial [Draconibacterium sp.]|nr:MBL fold metallo-hydrolase [Draconibacterium sp.]